MSRLFMDFLPPHHPVLPLKGEGGELKKRRVLTLL